MSLLAGVFLSLGEEVLNFSWIDSPAKEIAGAGQYECELDQLIATAELTFTKLPDYLSCQWFLLT